MRGQAIAAFAGSRALALVAGALAAASLGAAGRANQRKFDDPSLTHPLDGAGEDLLSPLARWDAVWYLDIARDGYEGVADTAFFPLYPLLVRGLVLPFASEATLLVAAYALSLGCFLGALLVMHRLAELELGRPTATAAVWLLALFPASVYFGAPYSESLFLLVSVGAFYAARTGRWAVAGAVAAAASATRSAGLVLLVPLLVLWLDSQTRRGRDLAWLALAPLGVAAYALYLGLDQGEPLAFVEAQRAWHRELAWPFAGIWDGTTAAWDAIRQLAGGSADAVYFDRAGGDPEVHAWINLVLFGSLLFAAVAVVGAFRRLPRAYGAYALAALALPLSYPVGPQPLMSLPRFVAVLFPLFMWLACATERRRWTPYVAVLSAAGLAAFSARFASWGWIA